MSVKFVFLSCHANIETILYVIIYMHTYPGNNSVLLYCNIKREALKKTSFHLLKGSSSVLNLLTGTIFTDVLVFFSLFIIVCLFVIIIFSS